MKTLLIFIFHITFCTAQNLVSNGSFESYDSLPTATGQINNCHNWKSSGKSPDYFHQYASVISSVGIPYNFTGTMPKAKEGQGCAGICTYIENWTNYREYLSQRLNDTLKINKSYHISLYIFTESNPCMYGGIATDNFSIALSKKKLHPGPDGIISFTPQLTYQSFAFGLNWTKIEFDFIADSNYRFITIGCFVNDSIQQQHQTNNPTLFECSYVFIDNVELTELSTTGIDEIAGMESRVKYFDLLGRPIEINKGGLYIRSKGNTSNCVFIPHN